VRDNIHRFGGDPDNVTVFGESAGGASIVALLAMPAARGLFHRAAIQSASFTQLRSRRRATEAAAQFLDDLGLTADDVDALLEMPVPRLLAAQKALLARPDAAFTAFAPTPDGTVLLEPPASAALPRVPVVIGTTRDEMHLFTFADPAYTGLDEAGLVRRAAAIFGDAAADVVAAYRGVRPSATPGQLASAIATDQAFRVPARRYAARLLDAGAPVWSYTFTQTTPVFGGRLGACHGLDIPYVFDNLHQRGVTLFTGDAPNRRAVAEAMHGAWVAFAYNGDPGWPPCTDGRRQTRRFGPEDDIVDEPDAGLLARWDTLGAH